MPRTFVGICLLVVAQMAMPSGSFAPTVLAQSPAKPAIDASKTSPTGLPTADPESVGMDALRLAGISEIVNEGIGAGKMPGCVVCIGRHGKIAYLEAFGNRQVGDTPQAMTVDTVFDMASITKPVVTATCVMKLIEQGRLRLGERVASIFPEFGVNGKESITIKQLLIHQSGLTPDNALRDYLNGPELAWKRICDLGLVWPVGTTFKYSDVNFIVLAKVIEQISGSTVHQFSQENVFAPLAMVESGYLPPESLRVRAAPTEKRDGQWMRGVVHDPRAFELGGVAGHAGLFSTANDLAVYAEMMLGRGTLRGRDVRILAPRTVDMMTRGDQVSGGLRGLGWDKRTAYSSNRGDLLSDSAFGHGGFTGTVIWIDPDLDLFFLFLSNRVHPNGKGSVNHLAGRIANIAAAAIRQIPLQADQKNVAAVATGLDNMVDDGFAVLADQRVGLITNHTGLAADGRSAIEIMNSAEDVDLRAIFSPEHGIAGKLDHANIGDTADAKTGLQVYSLYGKTRRPTAEMLADVDTIVFDIQDIGTRFYTYISTMGEAMTAAAEHGKRFVVLDRPNPIGGTAVRGPMLDVGKESFVGFHRLPVRHGMTIGEIARLLKEQLDLQLDLAVVPCTGWQRGDLWDAAGLVWVNPSPNMRTLGAALLYPGIGLLETTNLSVGRGTDTPFELFGAPWVNATDLAADLNVRGLAGVRFVPTRFTPQSSKFSGQECGGVSIQIVDRESLEPLVIGLQTALTLRKLYPDKWDTKNFNRLLGNDAVFKGVINGNSIDDVMRSADEGVTTFKRHRAKHLLYR